jgi:hypothetical protein
MRSHYTLALATLFLLFIGGPVMAAGTPSQRHDFTPGQVWSFHLDSDEH